MELAKELQKWLEEHNATINVHAIQSSPMELDITTSLLQIGVKFAVEIVEKPAVKETFKEVA